MKLAALALVAVGVDARLTGSQQMLVAKTSVADDSTSVVSGLARSLAEIQLRASMAAPNNVETVTDDLRALAATLHPIIDDLRQSHQAAYEGAQAFADDVSSLCEAPYGQKMQVLEQKETDAVERGEALSTDYTKVFGEGEESLKNVFVANSQALVASKLTRSGACCTANQKCPPDAPGVCKTYTLDKSISCDFSQPNSNRDTCTESLLNEYNSIKYSIASDAESYDDSSLQCANGVVNEDEKARAFAQSMADMHLETVYLAGQKSTLSSDLTDLAVDIEAAWAEYTACYGQLGQNFNDAMTKIQAHDHGDDTDLDAVHDDWVTIHYIKCVLEALVSDIDSSNAMEACRGAEIPEIDVCHPDDNGSGDGEGSGAVSLGGGFTEDIELVACLGSPHIPTFPKSLTDPAEDVATVRDGLTELHETTGALERVGLYVEAVVDFANCKSGNASSSQTSESSDGCAPVCIVNGEPVPSDTHLEFPPATSWEKHLAILNGDGPAPAPSASAPTACDITIKDSAFANKKLTSPYVIQDCVTRIGANAFMRSGLTSVVFPDSLTTIGDGAFLDNEITSVVFPDSVTTIGDGAFLRSGLTSVVFPDSLTTIGGYAFRDNQLTSVVIPDSVTFIGDGAFLRSGLKSVPTGPGTWN